MFNPQYDDARKTIARTQGQMLELGVLMNNLHPESGGNGLDDPIQSHQIVTHLIAEIHNVAHALGSVIDTLDQSPTDRAVGGNS